jgi:hypothetical protein
LELAHGHWPTASARALHARTPLCPAATSLRPSNHIPDAACYRRAAITAHGLSRATMSALAHVCLTVPCLNLCTTSAKAKSIFPPRYSSLHRAFAAPPCLEPCRCAASHELLLHALPLSPRACPITKPSSTAARNHRGHPTTNAFLRCGHLLTNGSLRPWTVPAATTPSAATGPRRSLAPKATLSA